MTMKLRCDFCDSRVGPIITQDMGDGRTLDLCPDCRALIRRGNEDEKKRAIVRIVDRAPTRDTGGR